MTYFVYDKVGRIIHAGDSYELARLALENAPDGSALFKHGKLLLELGVK